MKYITLESGKNVDIETMINYCKYMIKFHGESSGVVFPARDVLALIEYIEELSNEES